MTTGGAITITLTTLPSNYNISLLNSGGTVLQTSAKNGNNSESIFANVTTGATYYVRVYPAKNNNYNATTCYTLRVQTSNGANRISSTELVKLPISKFSVFPNPAGSVASLAFNAETNGNSEITLINQLGSIVMKKTMAVNEGENIRKLDVSSLVSGVYFIRIKNGNTIQTAKVVIKK